MILHFFFKHFKVSSYENPEKKSSRDSPSTNQNNLYHLIKNLC